MNEDISIFQLNFTSVDRPSRYTVSKKKLTETFIPQNVLTLRYCKDDGIQSVFSLGLISEISCHYITLQKCIQATVVMMQSLHHLNEAHQ